MLFLQLLNKNMRFFFNADGYIKHKNIQQSKHSTDNILFNDYNISEYFKFRVDSNNLLLSLLDMQLVLGRLEILKISISFLVSRHKLHIK